MSSKYHEKGAIAHRPTTTPGSGHVRKHKQRDKALEVVFDPKGCKEYVTGFRKRKQQRRKEAVRSLEQRQRAQRIEERAERRQAFKDQLTQAGYKEEPDAPPPPSDGEGSEAQPRVTTFQAGQLTSTVTVCAIAGSSDSEGAGASSADEGSDGGKREGDEAGAAKSVAVRQPGGQAPAPPPKQQQQQQQRKQPAWKAAAEGEEGVKKLSKCSLKVLEKTKLKISGKKGRPAGVPKRPSGAAAGSAGKKGAGGKKGGKGK